MTPFPGTLPEHAATEALLHEALHIQQRTTTIPPPPALADLRRRAESPRPAARTFTGARLAVAATVVVLAAGAAVGLSVGPGPAAPAAAAALDLSGGAPMVLRRIADATVAAPRITPPRLNQFVYTKHVGVGPPRNAGRDYSGNPVPSQTEMWIAEDPKAPSFEDLDGKRVTSNPLPADTPEPYAPSTYAQIAALPTDPAQMRAYLDKLTAGHPFDGADLLSNAIVSPEVASAVYRALADVPDLTVDSDVVDAVGRPGIGISQTDKDGFRAELIFSPDGSRLLGKRSLWTRDYDSGEPGDPKGRAGQVVGDYAVVEQAVVDRAWEQPS